MALNVQYLQLSALSPVKLNYRYKTTEFLKAEDKIIDSGLRYCEQELLKESADGSFSQETVVVLTDIKDLKEVFEETIEEKTIETFSASFYLAVEDTDFLSGDTILTFKNKIFFVGGTGTQAIFNLLPIDKKLFELKCDGKQVAVSPTYPYNLILLDEPLQEDIERQRFTLDYFNNRIVLKNNTAEGTRYLSYGIDRQMRFVGLQLNDTTVNNYKLLPLFLTSPTIDYNFNPSVNEIRYYRQEKSSPLNKNLTIKDKKQQDTSLLITCSLKDITSKNDVNTNIAITKTNFTTSGTFNTAL